MTTLMERLDLGAVSGADVIDWSCPVPFFGDLSSAVVATVGINPSNREFVDHLGAELEGDERRLPTLASLGRAAWGEVDGAQLLEIVNACRMYFRANPYDRWFRVLEQVLAGTATFYGPRPTACHLDLVPYATDIKWGSLSQASQRLLLAASGDALGMMLRNSQIEVLVLNGASVVKQFEVLTGRPLESQRMEGWTLPRAAGLGIPGFAYGGSVDSLGGVELPSQVRVFGYNHNLQSSFGVTGAVIANIGAWLASVIPTEQW